MELINDSIIVMINLGCKSLSGGHWQWSNVLGWLADNGNGFDNDGDDDPTMAAVMMMVMILMMASVMILNRFEFWPVLSSQGEAWRDQLTMVADFAGDDGDGENVTGMITMRSLMI